MLTYYTRTTVEGLIIKLTSDHILPNLLSLSSNVIIKQKKSSIINKRTNWDVFRSTLEETLTLSNRPRTEVDFENAVKKITNALSIRQK